MEAKIKNELKSLSCPKLLELDSFYSFFLVPVNLQRDGSWVLSKINLKWTLALTFNLAEGWSRLIHFNPLGYHSYASSVKRHNEGCLPVYDNLRSLKVKTSHAFCRNSWDLIASSSGLTLAKEMNVSAGFEVRWWEPQTLFYDVTSWIARVAQEVSEDNADSLVTRQPLIKMSLLTANTFLRLIWRHLRDNWVNRETVTLIYMFH